VWATRDASGLARVAAPLDGIEPFARELASGGGAWRDAARTLGERLLSGVEPLRRADLRHLVVVPDAALGAIPFEALELPGAGALVVERFDVAYAPTAALLLRDPPPARARWGAPWQPLLLAFGDPQVAPSVPGDALADALAAGDRRGALPASGDEVRAIAGLLGGRPELRLGADDLKAHLVARAGATPPVLHLGTHATADEVNPERSRILFSPASRDERADWLFLKEVYALDLRGVDLATLSACDTEVGKVVRGEGVQAFSRALLAAGARASVTALWRVADGATAELMKQFYFELAQGTPKAEALRRAKLRLLRSGGGLAHPRHWAAFVLNGDGVRPIPRAVPWSALALPLAAAAVLAAALARRRARRAAGAGTLRDGVGGSRRAGPSDAERSA